MIKPIETLYKGYRFRSRVEARWAVFFDTLDLPYEYEKEGFDIGGEWYLPDFWVPAWNAFVEIKGEKPTLDEIKKAKQLHNKTNKTVLVFSGPPWPKEYSIRSFGLGDGYDGEFPDGHMELRQCRRCPNIMAVFIDDKDFIWASMSLGHPNEDPNCRGCSEREPLNHDRILEAYERARQARFEHGETPS